jgi:hypothetical protein
MYLLIALPFAYFPMSKETSVSGLILPSYNDSNTRGFSLQNGGYYFALNDHYDLTVLETIILMVVMECDLNRPMLKNIVLWKHQF